LLMWEHHGGPAHADRDELLNMLKAANEQAKLREQDYWSLQQELEAIEVQLEADEGVTAEQRENE